MKKQHLLVLILSVFLIGGLSSSISAQVAPRPVTCLTNDHLHPVPGQLYTYTVSVPNVTTPTFTWFVTQNQDFIELVGTPALPQLNYTVALGAEPATGGAIMDAGAGYASPIPGSNNASIDITWKSFAYDPANPVFVVVQAIGNNGICTPNNLKVFKIEPNFAFTLDIDNLQADGNIHTVGTYGDTLKSCISDIQTATYDPSTPDGVIYDFGQNILYFEVTAANWYDRWQLGVQISGIASASGQTAQIDWAYAPTTRPIDYTTIAPIDWYSVVASATNGTQYTSSTLVEPQNGTAAVDELGESIIIRVIVDHNNLFEGIADLPINLAVDGILAHDVSGTWTVADPLEEGDIHTIAGGGPPAVCPWFDGYANDISLQKIMRRPRIVEVAPVAPAFLPMH